MAGGPAGRAYAPQDSLLYFQRGPPFVANLCAVVDCDAGFRPPPLCRRRARAVRHHDGAGEAGGSGTGLRTLQAPRCLLVGVRRTAREATRQAGFDEDRIQSRRRAGMSGCRPAAAGKLVRGPRLAGEEGGARRGGGMPRLLRLASAAWPRVETWPQAPRRSTPQFQPARCRTWPSARPTPPRSLPCRSLA